MVKIIGALHSTGTKDNITCCNTKDGYIGHQKKEPKATNSDRTKENMQEYGRAITGASLIRKTFAVITDVINDYHFARRLNGRMAKVVKSDKLNPRGYRNIPDGDIELLQGLDVNTNMALAHVFNVPFSASIDRTSGLMKVDFPYPITASLIARPKGSSHFKLSIAGASINFSTGEHHFAQMEGEYLQLSKESRHIPSMEVQIPPAATAATILALGISFYQKADGKFLNIGNGLYNAAAFVAVSKS